MNTPTNKERPKRGATRRRMQERRGRCLYLPRCVSISTTEQKTAKASTAAPALSPRVERSPFYLAKPQARPLSCSRRRKPESLNAARRPTQTTRERRHPQRNEGAYFGRILAVSHSVENQRITQRRKGIFAPFSAIFSRFLAVF